MNRITGGDFNINFMTDPIKALFWMLVIIVGVGLLVAAVVFGFLHLFFLSRAMAQTTIQGEVLLPDSIEVTDLYTRDGAGKHHSTRFVEFRIKGKHDPIRVFVEGNQYDLKLLQGHVYIKLSNEYRIMRDNDDKPVKYYRLMDLKQAKKNGRDLHRSGRFNLA